MVRSKTREFKDRQCRYCKRADKLKFRHGRPCCPLPNPRIRNGHCLERQPSNKPIGARSQKGSKVDNEELATPDGSAGL